MHIHLYYIYSYILFILIYISPSINALKYILLTYVLHISLLLFNNKNGTLCPDFYLESKVKIVRISISYPFRNLIMMWCLHTL